ncbi:hypothetical protein [Nocardioides aurantiacus]|uniref:hypothetical protein n=1 Tax=Nocardioides aurantiacus TaxID=86796 RepID=UPI001B886415|nr:hypothetical protein [Nocardioides aurantiacus]
MKPTMPFAILRTASSFRNVKLNAIARGLVELVASEQPLQNGRANLRDPLTASTPVGSPTSPRDH